jgi:hypothetical protein
MGKRWRLVDGWRLWAELRIKSKGIAKVIEPFDSASIRRRQRRSIWSGGMVRRVFRKGGMNRVRG